MIGTTVSHYRIVEQLGEGGMGVVYRAEDLKLDRTVALKFLAPEFVRDSEAKARFVHEAKAASALDHPNICTIHGIEETADGRLFIAMACYRGETLKDMIARGPLDVAEAAEIAVQAAQGLAKAHSLGIVHRDIKPANVFVTEDGLVKLLDFGIAKLAGQTQVTRPGAVIGTMHYMSPEQLQGEEVDRRTDVWSLGVVLYEMLAGKAPFTGESPQAIAWAILNVEPQPLRERRGDVPAGLELAVERCLRKAAAERYQSVEALVQPLQPLAGLGDARLTRQRAAGQHTLADARGVQPYPGLSSFSERDAEYFHGRESQVEAVWQKLRHGRLLAVAGPSGVGKTSFLRAGLVPAKPKDWGVLVATPGGSPFLSLREALVRELAGDTQAMLTLVRENDPDTDVTMARRWRVRHDEALLVLDQFEELFTLSAPAEQARFAELLSRLVLEADLHVLVSLRDDFLYRCHEHAGLAPVVDALTLLGPLTGPALRRALLQPALDCGYRFEDEALVDEMMAQVEGERGALPLLAFAMARLWELRDREQGLITRQAYAQIGAVGGALAQHGETVLEEIGGDRHGLVRELLRNLVTGQGTRAVLDREQLLSVFAAGDRAGAVQVLDQLVAARLLTTFEAKGEDGQNHHRIEIVHESLLSAWPRLVRWQTQDADGAQLRDQLRQAAQLWKERRESKDVLWTGTAYREFELWRERYPGGLTETEAAFGQAMAARARRDRRRRRLAVGAAFAMLLSVITVIGWYGQAQRRAHRESEAGRLVLLGREKLAASPTVALAHAIAALDLADNPENRRFALEALAAGPIAFVRPFAETNSQAAFVRFGPDGEHLAVGGHAGVQVLSRDESSLVVLEDDFNGWVRDPQFAPDGDRVIWSDTRDGSIVHVWSLAAGKEVRTFDLEASTAPLPRKERLILQTWLKDDPRPGSWTMILRAWSYDDRDPELVGRWSADTPGGWLWADPAGRAFAYTKRGQRGVYYATLEEYVGWRGRLVGNHDRTAYFPWFDPSGQRIATADSSGQIRIWSVAGATQEPLRVLQGEGPIHSLTFDPTGTMIAAVCGPRRTVFLWDLAGPREAEPVSFRFEYENRNFNYNVAFDPTGEWLVEPDLQELVFWPIRRPNMYLLNGVPVGFTPDGRTLVSVGIVREGGGRWPQSLWINDLQGGPTREHADETNVNDCALDPSGRFVVAGTRTGVYVMPLAAGDMTKQWLPDDPPGGEVQRVAVSADGTLIAAYRGGKDESGLRLWKLEPDTARILWKTPSGNLDLLVFDDDDRLFSAGAEGNIHQWSVQDGSSTLIGTGKLPLGNALAVTPDGRFLFANFWPASMPTLHTEYELTVFELENQTSRLITSRGGRITALALDAMGTRLVTGDVNGVVRVGPVTGEEPHVLIGQKAVTTIKISPDGRWIAASGLFDPVERIPLRLWRMPEGRPIHTLPHDEFLDYLRAQTNLRVVRDETADTGYRVEAGPFPGWETVPPAR